MALPISRRDLFKQAAIAAAGAGFASAAPAGRSVILYWLSGGLSHLDTFDLKPGAPREVRGEFREISTSVPGLRISEHLPETARLMNRVTLVRSMTSGESHHQRAMDRLDAGFLPVCCSDATTETASALDACRAVAHGSRCVTLRSPWLAFDTHSHHFAAMRSGLLPRFDRELSTLLRTLESDGLLASTLVVVTGEFGRSPIVNAEGGRDHHAGAWSALLAGAGVPTGFVLGATDRTGTEVVERPVTPEDLLATVDAILGRKPDSARGGGVIRELVKA